jgi:ABC-2 type transport system permease protein
MSRIRPVLHVARWEFRRYMKPKQQVVGFLITYLMLTGFAWIGRRGAEPSTVDIAVVAAEQLPALEGERGRFRFERHAAAELPGLLQAVEDRDRDAVLVVHDDGSGELHARQDPGWRAALERELTAASQSVRLERSGIDAQQIAAIGAPFQLTVHEAAPRAGQTERFAAIAALFLMIIGLFGGVGYVFSSVTGEKQNRLSEQVISTIPPQSWIDGKIIGLSAVSFMVILNFLVAGLLFLLTSHLVLGSSISIPTTVVRPGLLLLAMLFIVLGFFFWFTFLTAVAAIVDDPHTSTRNQLLFLPMLSVVPAFMAVNDANAAWVRTLAVLPPTSSGVLPVRLLVTDVPLWEPVLALLLLVAAIWLMRSAAGKVFRLGMLMYGKEPTWAEVRRWIREA